MAIAQQLKAMEDAGDDDSGSVHSEEKEVPKQPSNRNNKALQRKKP